MAAASNPRLAWSEVLGGLLVADDAASRLGVEPPTLVDAADRGEVIVLEHRDGRRVYPGFQFKHGWPPAALVEAWRTVAAAAVSPWTAAGWAATPDPRLGDRAPIDCASGPGAARILELAEQDAARLAA